MALKKEKGSLKKPKGYSATLSETHYLLMVQYRHKMCQNICSIIVITFLKLILKTLNKICSQWRIPPRTPKTVGSGSENTTKIVTSNRVIILKKRLQLHYTVPNTFNLLMVQYLIKCVKIIVEAPATNGFLVLISDGNSEHVVHPLLCLH